MSVYNVIVYETKNGIYVAEGREIGRLFASSDPKDAVDSFVRAARKSLEAKMRGEFILFPSRHSEEYKSVIEESGLDFNSKPHRTLDLPAVGAEIKVFHCFRENETQTYLSQLFRSRLQRLPFSE